MELFNERSGLVTGCFRNVAELIDKKELRACINLRPMFGGLISLACDLIGITDVQDTVGFSKSR